MPDHSALARVSALDDKANGELTPDEIANYDARVQRELTSFAKTIRDMFNQAAEGPQESDQFTRKIRSTIIMAIAAAMAHSSARAYLSLDRRRALETRVKALELAMMRLRNAHE